MSAGEQEDRGDAFPQQRCLFLPKDRLSLLYSLRLYKHYLRPSLELLCSPETDTGKHTGGFQWPYDMLGQKHYGPNLSKFQENFVELQATRRLRNLERNIKNRLSNQRKQHKETCLSFSSSCSNTSFWLIFLPSIPVPKYSKMFFYQMVCHIFSISTMLLTGRPPCLLFWRTS